MIKCFYKNIDNIKKILRYVGIIVFFGNNIYIEKFPKKCYDDIKMVGVKNKLYSKNSSSFKENISN